MTETPIPAKAPQCCQNCGLLSTLPGVGKLRLIKFGPHTRKGVFLTRWLCESCEWRQQRAYSQCERVGA